MKHIIAITLGLLICSPLTAADSDPSTKTLNVSIKGMSCEDCAYGITAALKKLKGVSLAKIDFSKKSGTIKYLLSETDEKKIIKTIEKSGYKATVKKK